MLRLDKVIVMPTSVSPHKSGKITASGEDRLALCRLAFAGIEGVEVSGYEIQQGGISYSADTCREFRLRYPDDELYFIVGADMLENFSAWKDPRGILSCVRLAACAREDYNGFLSAVENFERLFGEKVAAFNYVGANVSSTKIRTLAVLGEDFGEYVCADAAKYIGERSLYSIPRIKDVKKYLTPRRWAHTVRVALMSAENCSRVRISEQCAITAAALHDCAKYLSPSAPELEGFIPPQGVPQQVMHQYTGAYVAEHTFGVTDPDVLLAIRYHTSGRENMTDAEKLLYLCDMLEEGRAFDGVTALRNLFGVSVDECLFAALQHQIEYLKTTGGEIYPLTVSAYEYLKERKNGK